MIPRAPRRIVVTGRGLMTGLGLDLATSWRGLLAARPVAARFRQFAPGALPCDFGVELPPEAGELFASRIKTHHRKQMTRATMMAVLCAEEALAEAAFPASAERGRIGVVLGASGTGYVHDGPEPDPQRILRNMNNAPAAWVSIRNGLTGPAQVVSTACSSGAYALSTAVLLIMSGQCDAVVAGAAESIINPLDLGGFSALMALSTRSAEPARASRPFDAGRDGFVMGEGAGMLVLEAEEHARARGARILAQMHLPGLCSEAYNILSPAPGGTGMVRAMNLALAQAGLAPESIGYVNAHGTATQQNDRAETEAIKAVFGAHSAKLPVSSTKSLTGHTLSGAAGVEAVITLQALLEQTVPPTANLDQPDEGLDLDFVPHRPRPARFRHAMSNSFAFGGHNGVCILSAIEGEGEA